MRPLKLETVSSCSLVQVVASGPERETVMKFRRPCDRCMKNVRPSGGE